jgi:hypothetical protein
MPKTTLIALVTVAMFIVSTVLTQRADGERRRIASPTANTESPSQTESLMKEGRQFALDYWKGLLTKCGDSYYWKEVWGESDQIYYQAKGEPVFSFEGRYVPPRVLTRAEQLNGVDPQPIEFEGATFMSFEVGRILKGVVCTLDKCQWKDNYRIGERIIKSKGVMQFQRNRGVRERRPVDCSEISNDPRGRPPLEQRGVELNSYCKNKYGQSAVATSTPGDAFSWRCRNGGQAFDIDIDEACKLEHGVDFTAKLGNRNDHTSWQCQRTESPSIKPPGRLVTSPNISGLDDKYSIRLFNCDDGCRALIGDKVILETGFGQDSGWLTDPGAQSGKLRFQVINQQGAITYGFQVRKGQKIVFEEICGTSRVRGCENDRDFSAGMVREFTYELVKH